MAIPMGLRLGTQLGFFLGPSVIDSSFQALMALADADVGIGSLKIPLSIKRCGLGPIWLKVYQVYPLVN
jgi:hypothetical protein